MHHGSETCTVKCENTSYNDLDLKFFVLEVKQVRQTCQEITESKVNLNSAFRVFRKVCLKNIIYLM